MKDLISHHSFCALPFLGICIEAGGRNKPCCKYRKWNSDQLATKFSLKELFATPFYQDIRNRMLQGERLPECRRCWDDEKNGLNSMRTTSNKKYGSLLSQLQIQDPSVKMIDFGFGNTCNAACVTCESSSSQKWIEDDLHLASIENNIFERNAFSSHQDQFAWSTDDYKGLVHVVNAQNEVLASKEFPLFLDRLEKSSPLENRTLYLSTNGSIWPNERIINQIKSFKDVRIQVSIDGLREANDYIRFPLKWDRVAQITEKWLDLAQNNSHIHLNMRCTISIYNVLDVNEIRDWWNQFSGGAHLSYGYCWFPHYLSPLIFARTLGPYITADRVAQVPELVKMLNHVQDDPRMQKLFWKFTEILDRRRGLNFERQFPELHRLLKTAPARLSYGS